MSMYMKRFSKALLGATLALACVGLLVPETVEAQSMSRREIRYNMRKAKIAFKRQQYEKASRLLFDIVENGGESPKSQRSARYNLARALVRQKLHLVAIDYNVTVLKNTPPKSRSSRFTRSMRNLIRIADAIKDDTLILKLFETIPKLRTKLVPDKDPVITVLNNRRYVNKRWWKPFHQKMAYLMGRFAYLGRRSNQKRALRFLRLVKSDAPGTIYPKALYLRGIITSTRGKYKEAFNSFRKILARPVPRKGGGTLLDIKALAQYGIARSLYAKGRIAQARFSINPKKHPKKKYMGIYSQALVEYYKIPKQRGIFQAQMLFETAYTYFMMDRFHFSLGQLLALQSPFYRTGFFPELQILRALIYFKTCKYEDTKQTVIDFRKQYTPLQKKLTGLLSKVKRKNKGTWSIDKYYDYYNSERKKLKNKQKTDIPASIITSISKEKALKTFRGLLQKVQAELNIIRGKSGGWRESNVGKALLRRALGLRGVMRRRAGGAIYSALRYLRNDINKQVNNSRIIQLETLQNQKKELLRYAEGGGIEQDEFRYTIVTEQSHIYWPYQGEYWRDEVGYYRQFIQGECKQ